MRTAGFGGSFVPIVQYEKWEIHPVFPHFPYFRSGQNLSPNLLAPLCGAALILRCYICFGYVIFFQEFLKITAISDQHDLAELSRADIFEPCQKNLCRAILTPNGIETEGKAGRKAKGENHRRCDDSTLSPYQKASKKFRIVWLKSFASSYRPWPHCSYIRNSAPGIWVTISRDASPPSTLSFSPPITKVGA